MDTGWVRITSALLYRLSYLGLGYDSRVPVHWFVHHKSGNQRATA